MLTHLPRVWKTRSTDPSPRNRAARSLVFAVLLVLLGVTVLASVPSSPVSGRLPAARVAVQQQGGPQTRGAVHDTSCALFDMPCYLQQVAESLAQNIFTAVKPILTYLTQWPGNFITQTSPDLTYNHPQVQRITAWTLGVADLALVIVVALAGYQVMIGRSIGLQTSEVMALVPRIALAFLAANLWPFITGLLIDFNNALCLGMIQLLTFTWLENLIQGIFNTFSNPLTGSFGAPLVLIILFIVCLLFLTWQMLVRLALIVLLIVLAPLGLFALAIPFTQSWGQMWLSMFAHTVLIQFFQVLCLSVGGMLVTYLAQANILAVGYYMTTLLVGCALLYLTIQLPSMMREYALRPIMKAGEQSGNAAVSVITRIVATI